MVSERRVGYHEIPDKIPTCGEGSLAAEGARLTNRTARFTTRALEQFKISARVRTRAVPVLVALDLIGCAAVLKLCRHELEITWDVVAAGAALVVIGYLSGLYKICASGDLKRAAMGASALGGVLLFVTTAVIWCLAGEQVALSLAASGGLILVFLVSVRLAGDILITSFRRQVIERVLIVGKAYPADCRRHEETRLFGVSVCVINQIMIDDSTCDPLLPDRIANAVAAERSIGAPVRYIPRGADKVFIVKAGLSDPKFREVVRAVDALSIPIHILSAVTNDDRLSDSRNEDCWILRDAAIKPGSMMAKRMMDVVLSLLALAFVAPVLILIGVLIRLESPGPALFRQVRLGRDNRRFTVLKFRTMRLDSYATDGSIQAVRGDPRVTRLGAILRKTSLDELPQLLNVLYGSMSLVGPRPHPTELNRRFEPLIASYSARHRIAPGITGWAQVNGYRGETRTVEDMRRRVEHDLEYIHSRSFAFDFWILLKTTISLVTRRNAY